MNTGIYTNPSFKGYDARPLKGFLMSGNCYGITKEMANIGKKEGFDVFTVTDASFFKYVCSKKIPSPMAYNCTVWAQDMWTFVKDKILSYDNNNKTDAVTKCFNVKQDFTQKIIRDIRRSKNTELGFFDLLKQSFSGVGTKEKQSAIFVEKFDKRAEENRQDELRTHIKGGNVFIIKGDDGKDELIIGQNELENFELDDIRAMYDVEKVTILPQMDFHLDLFIRPLDNKRILLADDTMTVKLLKKALQNLQRYMEENSCINENVHRYEQMRCYLNNFLNSILENPYAKTKEIMPILKKAGYEVIRVPARVYEPDVSWEKPILYHDCNYLNANVFKNKNGDLVYITNKSKVDKFMGLTEELSEKIGFSFEDEFVKSILPYVKKEHIYFITGQDDFVANMMLREYQGGIHCACAEIPESVKINE